MPSTHEYIYGVNTVTELLSSHPDDVLELLLARERRDPRIQPLLELAEARGINIHPRPHDVLSRLAGNDHHQGVVAVVKGFAYVDLDDLLESLKGKNPLLVLLDGVQDPQNLGALIRSALLFGAHGVVIPRDRAAGVTPAARKASAGAAAHIPVAQVTNLARTLVELFENHGFWLAGLDQDAKDELSRLDLTVPLGLVLGGEGKGLRPITRKHVQLLGRIPLSPHPGGVDSLNVSAAGAVALYEVSRQRVAKK